MKGIKDIFSKSHEKNDALAEHVEKLRRTYDKEIVGLKGKVTELENTIEVLKAQVLDLKKRLDEQQKSPEPLKQDTPETVSPQPSSTGLLDIQLKPEPKDDLLSLQVNPEAIEACVTSDQGAAKMWDDILEDEKEEKPIDVASNLISPKDGEEPAQPPEPSPEPDKQQTLDMLLQF